MQTSRGSKVVQREALGQSWGWGWRKHWWSPATEPSMGLVTRMRPRAEVLTCLWS